MRLPWLALLGAAVALSCVGAEDPLGTTRSYLLCVESVAPDARGDPRNAEGRIRQCWPGEPSCYCDRDDDCYALDGYAPCAPRAPDPPPSVRAQLRLPSDAMSGTFAPANVEPEPTGSPWTYCQRYHGGVDAHAYAFEVTQRIGIDLSAAQPSPQGSRIKTIALRRASAPAADIACEDWGDNDADTYGWWPRVRRVLDPGQYLVLVDGWAGEDYALSLQTFAPPPSARCATAPALPTLDAFADVDTALGGPGATACYKSATRPQSFYAVTIPPRRRAVVIGSHKNYDTRLVLRSYTGCNANQCLGAVTTGGETLSARLENYTRLAVDNRLDATRRVLIGVSAAPGATSEADAHVSVQFAPLAMTEAVNARCSGAKTVVDGTRLEGEDTRLARAAASCDAEVFQGHALYYRARVPAHRTLVISATSTGEGAIAPHIRVLGGCGATTCLASVALGRPRDNPVVVRHTNDSNTALTWIVAVSDTFASGGGPFDLSFSITNP